MAAHEYAAPQPLPDNRRAWAAFLRVCNVQHYVVGPMGMLVPHRPNWSDIESILTLHRLWDADVQTRLVVCFAELMVLEAEKRKAENV